MLLVEDNPVNQQVAVGMLENLGCQVDVAANGLEAVDAVQSREYDTILMDCQMPEMDGYEATRIIREREAKDASQHMPIIALTAHALQEHRERCLDAGMDDYLSKPFTIDNLYNVLCRWLPPPSHLTCERVPSVSASDPAPTVPMAPRVAGAMTINWETLDALRALQQHGSPDLLGRVIHTYFHTASQLLETLQTAVAQDDTTTVQQAAHSLKSSSGNVGAQRLMTLCRALETMGKTCQTENTADLLSNISVEYKAVRMALEAELKEERDAN